MNSRHRKFSHIYVERGALELPRSQLLLDRFSTAEKVIIDDYKEVFNRPRQNWTLQKASRKLILAKKKNDFAYPCGEIAPHFGFEHFYYNALMFNCIYDCSYCYLQGMYPSANIVIFTNLEDYFSETDRLLDQKSPLYLCISYDTDLLALNSLLPYAEEWIAYTASRKNLCIELRTKSVNVAPLLRHIPCENVVLAWTLSPASISERYESLTPPLDARLRAIQRVIQHGWKVRLCFDPLLNVPNWQAEYQNMLDRVFEVLSAEGIRDVSIGTFRMNSKYLKRVKKIQPTSDILHANFSESEGVSHYAESISTELTSFMYRQVKEQLPRHNIVVTT